MVKSRNNYPATLKIDYPKKLDRLTTLLRIFWVIPILVILSLISGVNTGTFSESDESEVAMSSSEAFANEFSQEMTYSGLGIAGGLAVATALMILVRQRYPRWWFNFALELYRFQTRVGAYMALMTDKYPSTEDEQTVHLNVTYPNVEKDLNRYLPLVKWLLAIPHYVVLLVLGLGAVFAVVIAWLSILVTGTYPRGLFDFVEGVNRWGLRVSAYAFLLTTDQYPPFSLK